MFVMMGMAAILVSWAVCYVARFIAFALKTRFQVIALPQNLHARGGSDAVTEEFWINTLQKTALQRVIRARCMVLLIFTW
jgi:hypothetical protein